MIHSVTHSVTLFILLIVSVLSLLKVESVTVQPISPITFICCALYTRTRVLFNYVLFILSIYIIFGYKVTSGM